MSLKQRETCIFASQCFKSCKALRRHYCESEDCKFYKDKALWYMDRKDGFCYKKGTSV